MSVTYNILTFYTIKIKFFIKFDVGDPQKNFKRPRAP